jgi:hypothetical protein
LRNGRELVRADTAWGLLNSKVGAIDMLDRI